jgi:hypothetical protein
MYQTWKIKLNAIKVKKKFIRRNYKKKNDNRWYLDDLEFFTRFIRGFGRAYNKNKGNNLYNLERTQPELSTTFFTTLKNLK